MRPIQTCFLAATLASTACSVAGAGDDVEASGTTGESGSSSSLSSTAGPGGTTVTPSGDSSSSTTGDPGTTTTGDETTSETTGGDATTGSPPGGMCDPAEQDCPPGEKCTAYREAAIGCCTDANKCVPAMGNLQAGDDCWREEDNDDCDVGLFCWTTPITGEGPGVCHSFCDVNVSGACDSGYNCKSFNDGTLPLCVKACDPLAPVCPSSQGCYLIFENEFACANTVAVEGGGADGDSCSAVNSCLPGNACVFAETKPGCETSRCCTAFCDVNDSSPCSDGEMCVSLFAEGNAPPGLDDVGVCGIPQ